MTDPIIRPVAPGELAALHAVIERAYRGESARAGWSHEADLIDGRRIAFDDLRAIAEDPRARLLVALRGDAAIGGVHVGDLGGGRAYLGLLCIDPRLQAAGLGRRLIAAAERVATKAFGASAIEMTVISVRDTLIAYYIRRGYRLTGERRPFPIALDPPLEMEVLDKTLA